MNIFVLDPSPAIAASYHCDQHLHKMILESAQILSRIASRQAWADNSAYYKPTHANHPCTLWAGQSVTNAFWLVQLAQELDKIRLSLGCKSHKSMAIINKFIDDYCFDEYRWNPPASFIFCGPASIASRTNLSVHQQYQEAYRYKQLIWPRPMTWKNRTVPTFMLNNHVQQP